MEETGVPRENHRSVVSWLANFITKWCIEYTSLWTGFTTLYCVCTKPEKCATGIDSASFYHYSGGSWKYSESGIFCFSFVSYQVITHVLSLLEFWPFPYWRYKKKPICLPSWLQKPRQKIEWLYFFTYAYSSPVNNHIRYLYCDTCEECKSVKCIHYLSEL